MAAAALFFSLLLLTWLFLGVSGWLVTTLRFRPCASLRALAAALAAAPIAGALPGVLGWRTLPGLLSGLALALVCSTAAAWQTMSRTARCHSPPNDEAE